MALDPSTPARHLPEAAMLILARRSYRVSQSVRIEISMLGHAFQVDDFRKLGGRPVRQATFTEESSKAAVNLAEAIHHALGWPITIAQLVIPGCGG